MRGAGRIFGFLLPGSGHGLGYARMSTLIEFTPKTESELTLRIRDLEDGDLFLRTKAGKGDIGIIVEGYVIFLCCGGPLMYRRETFADEVIERRIDSVKIIER